MIEQVKYAYAMNVKLSQLRGETDVHMLFPNIEDLVITSREFERLEDAVASANMLSEQVTRSLNEAVLQDLYQTLSEINPRLSNKETISKDWGPNEVAKVWIIDQQQQRNRGVIRAIALAQLLEVPGPAIVLN